MHVQHISGLPDTITHTLSKSNITCGPFQWRGSDEYDSKAQLLKPARWKRYSNIGSSVVKHDPNWVNQSASRTSGLEPRVRREVSKVVLVVECVGRQISSTIVVFIKIVKVVDDMAATNGYTIDDAIDGLNKLLRSYRAIICRDYIQPVYAKPRVLIKYREAEPANNDSATQSEFCIDSFPGV
ncbi:hypothetical protein Tco_1546820 [Tanacetum coccineum]